MFILIIAGCCFNNNEEDEDKTVNIDKVDVSEENQQNFFYEKFDLVEECNIIKNDEEYNLYVEIIPFRIDYEIKLEVANPEILDCSLNFCKEEQKLFLKIKPNNAGQTFIKINVPMQNGFVEKQCEINIQNQEENFELSFLGEKNFLSGKKADESYEIYSAYVKSCQNLSVENFIINKSDNIKIVENSVNIFNHNEGTTYSFDFIIVSGKVFNLQVVASKKYDNINYIINTGNLSYDSKEFVDDVTYQIYDSNGMLLSNESNYDLYIKNNDYENLMISDGLNIYYDLLIDPNIFDLYYDSTILDVNLNQDKIRISPLKAGKCELKIVAKDGSMFFKTITINNKIFYSKTYNININNKVTSYQLTEIEKLILKNNIVKLEKGEMIEIKITKDKVYAQSMFSIDLIENEIFKIERIVENDEIILRIIAKNSGESILNINKLGELFSQLKIKVIEPDYKLSIINYNELAIFDDENNKITINFDETNNLYFEFVLLKDDQIINGALYNVSVSDNSYCDFDDQIYANLFLKILKEGDFYITIKEITTETTRTIKVVVL